MPSVPLRSQSSKIRSEHIQHVDELHVYMQSRQTTYMDVMRWGRKDVVKLRRHVTTVSPHDALGSRHKESRTKTTPIACLRDVAPTTPNFLMPLSVGRTGHNKWQPAAFSGTAQSHKKTCVRSNRLLDQYTSEPATWGSIAQFYDWGFSDSTFWRMWTVTTAVNWSPKCTHLDAESSPVLDYERWARSWPRFLGSQPADDLVINPVVGCRHFSPGRRLLRRLFGRTIIFSGCYAPVPTCWRWVHAVFSPQISPLGNAALCV